MSDLAKLVIKGFPENRNMQLMLLRVPGEFHCFHCSTIKKAKLVAVVGGDWNRLLCNECYGKLLSEPSPIADVAVNPPEEEEER